MEICGQTDTSAAVAFSSGSVSYNERSVASLGDVLKVALL